MKKIPSGQGATDFGSATGLSQDELFGRAESTKADSPQKILNNLATAMPIGEPQIFVSHTYEGFSLPPDWHDDEESLPTVKLPELEKKIKDIIYAHWQNAGTGFPHWISHAAEVIMGHIG